eukprot:m.53582 g.53582  ORF g.53582 m.53582 type:complete len:166 (-) comp21784_c1_seq1:82-579(-)
MPVSKLKLTSPSSNFDNESVCCDGSTNLEQRCLLYGFHQFQCHAGIRGVFLLFADSLGLWYVQQPILRFAAVELAVMTSQIIRYGFFSVGIRFVTCCLTWAHSCVDAIWDAGDSCTTSSSGTKTTDWRLHILQHLPPTAFKPNSNSLSVSLLSLTDTFCGSTKMA